MAKENHVFSQVPKAQIPRSRFDRSHGHKTTFNAGDLVPIYLDEVLPGDTFELRCSAFARLTTPIVPIMDNMFMDFFWFFVPNRLLWSNWQKFMGEQTNPGDSISYLVPQMTTPAGGHQKDSLADYFGIPVAVNNMPAVSALPFRAYNQIWNEWFRDENLQTALPKSLGDGPDSIAGNYVVKKRGKRHDYFTSCLPWPQKGNVASTIPLGTTAPVIGLANQNMNLIKAGGTGTLVGLTALSEAITTGAITGTAVPTVGSVTLGLSTNPGNSGLVADLSTATAATINQLRQAFQVQRLLERDARGGTRYIEILKAHFGVVSPDARLQRPEYLGGGSIPVSINPVVQNSATVAGQTPQGNTAAFGTASGTGIGFTKSFVEHGYIMGLVSVRADLNYYQGIERGWTRRTRYDYYWPAFAMLGEQAVLNQEIYSDGSANDALVFGYQERWAEYRYKPNRITGQFRPNVTPNLKEWHLAQEFASLPTLGDTFIQENPPMARIKAVTTQPDFRFDSYFKIACTRPMPVYSVPGMLDHF